MQEENENPVNIRIAKPKNEGVFGPIIGSAIIILLIILGGLYFWSYLVQERGTLTETKTQETLEVEVEQLSQEIKAEDLDVIDSDLKMIEAEIDSALAEEASSTQE